MASVFFFFLAAALAVAVTAARGVGAKDDGSLLSCDAEFQVLLRHLDSTAGGVHLPLHHPRGPCSPSDHVRRLPLSTVFHHDDARAASFAARLAAAPAITASATSVPLSRGTSVGVGNYITRVGFGGSSPSVVVVDTGSSLSWIQCRPCAGSCYSQIGPVFNPASSSTYKRIPCSSPHCSDLASATLNPSVCSRGSCIYTASYGDGSFSQGYLSDDTVSVGGAAFPGTVFGCGQDNEGLFGQADGLVGFANSDLSLFRQIAPKAGGLQFAYCLPSSDSGTGFLSIGSGAPAAQYTPLVSNSADGSLYFVNLAGITVAGAPLPVSSSAYTSLPTVVDSGTVITRLPDAVYAALKKAVATAMWRRYAKASAFSILDTCYKGSVAGMSVPAVSLLYQGGAAMALRPSNVFIDVDGSTTCLAFAPSSSVTIIGNTQQQSFTVAYDVANSRVGFAAGGCR